MPVRHWQIPAIRRAPDQGRLEMNQTVIARTFGVSLGAILILMLALNAMT
jgi:hypothetical protein